MGDQLGKCCTPDTCCLPKDAVVAHRAHYDPDCGDVARIDAVIPKCLAVGDERLGAAIMGTDLLLTPLQAVPAAPPSPPAADSCALLSGLDFLTQAEWQTAPLEEFSTEDEALQLEAMAAGDAAAAHAVALKSLWHNCPRALEAALGRFDRAQLCESKALDAALMGQKLEFTQIRLQFLKCCRTFALGGGPEELRKAVAEVESRCDCLIAAQADEQESALPGLISRRDTIMLASRIQEIAEKLLADAGWASKR